VHAFVRACMHSFFHLMMSRRKSDQAGDASVQPGMVTYTIPGVAFGMPSSVGPLHFAPVFTSRHTAKIAWVRPCLCIGCVIFLQVLAKRVTLRLHVCRVLASMTHSDVVGILVMWWLVLIIMLIMLMLSCCYHASLCCCVARCMFHCL